jgi:putative ABC transport system permease protein
VIGVLPRGFRFPLEVSDAEVWTPLGLDDPEALKERGMHYLEVVGRLKPGVGIEQAGADLQAVAGRLAQSYPDSNAERTATVSALQEQVVGSARRGLLVLLGAVAFVLLVACANVANLLLARSSDREAEVALRSALGAGRGRIARQFLTESGLLAFFGGGLGLLLAFWGVDLLVSFAPADFPRLAEVHVDLSVLAFTLLLSLLTGIVFGTAPAFRASRLDVAGTLKEAGRGSGGASRGRRRLRSTLIVAEVALSLVLLVGAGLMLRSFARILAVDPGFDPNRVVTAQLSIPDAAYPKLAQAASFYQQMLRRLASLPGVEAVGTATPLPFAGNTWITSFRRLDRPEPAPSDRFHAHYAAATSGSFRALRIPLQSGRLLDDGDVRGRPRVVLVNATLARRLFRDEDPLDKQVAFGVALSDKDEPSEENASWQVVGVVGDTAPDRLDAAPEPIFYVSAFQHPLTWMDLVVRGSGDPRALAEAVRKQVVALDRDVPVFRVQTMPELLSRSVAQRRFQTLLLASFAGLGLLLSAVGLYGVMAFSVGQRTRELGIRMVLGAERGRVLRLVVAQGMGLALAGVAVGLVAALAFTRVLESLLFGLSATDPPSFGAAAGVLIGTTLLASYLPARRAARLEPSVALRWE